LESNKQCRGDEKEQQQIVLAVVQLCRSLAEKGHFTLKDERESIKHVLLELLEPKELMKGSEGFRVTKANTVPLQIKTTCLEILHIFFDVSLEIKTGTELSAFAKGFVEVTKQDSTSKKHLEHELKKKHENIKIPNTKLL